MVLVNIDSVVRGCLLETLKMKTVLSCKENDNDSDRGMDSLYITGFNS